MKYLVYAEMRVSYVVKVDAPDAEMAEALAYDELPGANLENVDIASDWEVLSVTDDQHREVGPS